MKIVGFLILFFVLFACGNEDNVLYLVTDNAQLLEVDEPILSDTIQIGVISDIRLIENIPLLTLKFNDSIKISKKVKLSVSNLGLFQRSIRCYENEPYGSVEYFDSGDTIHYNLSCCL